MEFLRVSVLLISALCCFGCSGRKPSDEGNAEPRALSAEEQKQQDQFLERVKAAGKHYIMLDGKGHVVDLGTHSSMELSHEDMETIGRMSEVWRLNFGAGKGSTVDDEGIACLKALHNVKWLILSKSQVTDASMKHVGAMAKLERLHLIGLPITDAGLRELSGLTELKEITLGGSQVTDTGLQVLKGMPNLTDLDLSNTPVTDAGLLQLRSLSKLNTLNLVGTAVTDEGMKTLMELPKLSWLYLQSTKVTDDAVAKLRDRFPGINIGRPTTP